MFSFLISTYNYDCSRLLHDIDAQCAAFRERTPEFDYEILIGDDASTDADAEQANRRAAEALTHCRYVTVSQNQGQANMRNRLCDAARFPYLVFMDSDAQVCDGSFVENYWQNREKAPVVCGSVRNPSGRAAVGTELRWRYEHKAEKVRTVAFRAAHPFNYFTAFNVLIHRDVFQRIRFDARCTKYGYEDALFGLQLQKLGIQIAHIDNPLVHLGIDSNASFLAKTETALQTLHSLGSPMTDFAGPSRLQRKLQRFGLSRLAATAFCAVRPLLRRHFLGHRPSLLLFAVYKLGYYCDLCRK